MLVLRCVSTGLPLTSLTLRTGNLQASGDGLQVKEECLRLASATAVEVDKYLEGQSAPPDVKAAVNSIMEHHRS